MLNRVKALHLLEQKKKYNVVMYSLIEHELYDKLIVYKENVLVERSNKAYIYGKLDYFKLSKHIEYVFGVEGSIDKEDSRVLHYCELTEFKMKSEPLTIKLLESKEELEEYYHYLKTIEAVDLIKGSYDSFMEYQYKLLRLGLLKIYAIYDDEIVSSVSVSYIDEKEAVVKRVSTNSKYRGFGYSKKLLIYLCDIYVNELNKSLYLYYEDSSIKIYDNLGFKKIGNYIIKRRNNNE